MSFDNGQRFANPIALKFLGQRCAIVTCRFQAHGETFEAGWVTDGASVPPSGESVIPRWIVLAAFVHDRRYEEILKRYVNRTITKREAMKQRKQADKEFLINLKYDGYGWTRRTLAYRAVRMFGWGSFQKSDRIGLIEKASK